MSASLVPLTTAHLDRVLDLWEVSFGQRGWFGAEEAPTSQTAALERGEIHGWVDGDEIQAVASLWSVDHWFGGREVSCQHVGGVGVPPELRGRGIVSDAMRAAMLQGIDAGNALSILFATTTKLYRGLGWDLAGSFNAYRLDARHVPPVGPAMRPLTEADWPAVERADVAWRRTLNGPAVRLDHDWVPLRQARFAYGLDAAETGELEAYLLYDVAHDLGEYWYYSLNLLDWAATTPRGLETVLGFIGRHGTMGKRAAFKGPVPHPWAYLTPEQDVERIGGGTWLVRPLDAAKAIAQRGYAEGVSVDVRFELHDVEIPRNRGPWRLRVNGGQGELTSSRAANVEMDVRAFGPLFTGYAGIEQLRLAGLVRGPSPALAALGAAFAGPAPVMLEFF